jgi:hypothetical protein
MAGKKQGAPVPGDGERNPSEVTVDVKQSETWREVVDQSFPGS